MSSKYSMQTMRLTYMIQDLIWKTFEEIGDKEGRLDVCIGGHGVLPAGKSALDFRTSQVDQASIRSLLAHDLV